MIHHCIKGMLKLYLSAKKISLMEMGKGEYDNGLVLLPVMNHCRAIRQVIH